MFIDLSNLRERLLFKGASQFARRVLLAALIKGTNNTRRFILNRVELADFDLPHDDLIFSAIVQSFKNSSTVDIDYIYRYVKQELLTSAIASQREFTLRIWNKPLPPPHILDKALECMQLELVDVDYEADDFEERYLPLFDPCLDYEMDEEWVTVVSLLRGDKATQQRILASVTIEQFNELNIDKYFTWGVNLLKTHGQIPLDTLLTTAEKYATDEVHRTYRHWIDRLLAIDLPDQEMIEKAISYLEEYRT